YTTNSSALDLNGLTAVSFNRGKSSCLVRASIRSACAAVFLRMNILLGPDVALSCLVTTFSWAKIFWNRPIMDSKEGSTQTTRLLVSLRTMSRKRVEKSSPALISRDVMPACLSQDKVG